MDEDLSMDHTDAVLTAAEVARRNATRCVDEQLTAAERGAVTVSGPVLHLDGQQPSVTLSGPDGSVDLRVDRATGQPRVHLISAGFPHHGMPGTIDTQLGVNLGATVINVPDADLREVVRPAIPLLADAQRQLDREHDAIRAGEDGQSLSAGEMPSLEWEPSAQYADMAERNANLAIDGAASTATLADDGDASAARVAALGARGAAVSGGRGSLDPHKATQVAVAASATTRQRLREVHEMVDQVAAQRAATPASDSSGRSSGARTVAPRYADRTDYVSPCVDTNAPTLGQG